MGWASRLNKSPRDGNTPASRRRDFKDALAGEDIKIRDESINPKSELELMLLLSSPWWLRKKK